MFQMQKEYKISVATASNQNYHLSYDFLSHMYIKCIDVSIVIPYRYHFDYLNVVSTVYHLLIKNKF